MSGKKAQTDWERIELDYRAGVLSVREIAAASGVSHTAIQKRAKAQGWERDLAGKIRAKAEALVAKAEVANRVATETSATEREVIEANAARIAQIRGEHRADIRRGRNLVLNLLAELEAQTGAIADFEALAEMLRAPDDSGVDKLNDLYRKVISLPSRVDTAKKLSEALKNLIGLEREAYSIASEPTKIDLTTKGEGRKLQDMTDDELLAIATGGAGAADPAQGAG